MNTTISFEIAKLLKEKGFDVPTRKYYEYVLKSKKDKENGYSGSFGWKKGELNLQSDYFQNNSKSDYTSEIWYMCSAPTITEVVMWLYEKHGIWINVDSECYGINWYSHILPCSKEVYDNLELRSKVYKSRFFIDASKTLTEAYSKSIKYCLTELI